MSDPMTTTTERDALIRDLIEFAEAWGNDAHVDALKSLLRDSQRLDWMEQNKGRGKGGWEVVAPSDGWMLNVRARGPYNSLRRAIDAAMQSDPLPSSEKQE